MASRIAAAATAGSGTAAAAAAPKASGSPLGQVPPPGGDAAAGGEFGAVPGVDVNFVSLMMQRVKSEHENRFMVGSASGVSTTPLLKILQGSKIEKLNMGDLALKDGINLNRDNLLVLVEQRWSIWARLLEALTQHVKVGVAFEALVLTEVPSFKAPMEKIFPWLGHPTLDDNGSAKDEWEPYIEGRYGIEDSCRARIQTPKSSFTTMRKFQVCVVSNAPKDKRVVAQLGATDKGTLQYLPRAPNSHSDNADSITFYFDLPETGPELDDVKELLKLIKTSVSGGVRRWRIRSAATRGDARRTIVVVWIEQADRDIRVAVTKFCTEHPTVLMCTDLLFKDENYLFRVAGSATAVTELALMIGAMVGFFVSGRNCVLLYPDGVRNRIELTMLLHLANMRVPRSAQISSFSDIGGSESVRDFAMAPSIYPAIGAVSEGQNTEFKVLDYPQELPDANFLESMTNCCKTAGISSQGMRVRRTVMREGDEGGVFFTLNTSSADSFYRLYGSGVVLQWNEGSREATVAFEVDKRDLSTRTAIEVPKESVENVAQILRGKGLKEEEEKKVEGDG